MSGESVWQGLGGGGVPAEKAPRGIQLLLARVEVEMVVLAHEGGGGCSNGVDTVGRAITKPAQ